MIRFENPRNYPHTIRMLSVVGLIFTFMSIAMTGGNSIPALTVGVIFMMLILLVSVSYLERMIVDGVRHISKRVSTMQSVMTDGEGGEITTKVMAVESPEDLERVLKELRGEVKKAMGDKYNDDE